MDHIKTIDSEHATENQIAGIPSMQNNESEKNNDIF